MKTKRALITGITGQDGSYLAELLLSEGYVVIGVTSGKSSRIHINAIADQIVLVTGDITDPLCVRELIHTHVPDEVYNLASVSSVGQPWVAVEDTVRATGLAPLHFLEGIRETKPDTRFFQASSAEMYGVTTDPLQTEDTLLHPLNPYGVSKTFAHHMVGAYRRAHGLFATSGILFNHESPRRGEHFVTRKITRTLAQIKRGLEEPLFLGNIDAKRDWGFAGDYVRAMHSMLTQEMASDYVIATGIRHSVRQLIETAGDALQMPITWEGAGLDEVGVTTGGKVIIRINKDFYRPVEAHVLCGDSTKAQQGLGWKPRVSFEELVAMMVRSDLECESRSL